MELYELTAHELIEKLNNKEITSTEITSSFLKRAKEKESNIQAFITLTEKEALEDSKKENAFIPIGIKDNINTKGVKTTCASKMLQNYISPYDATVIEKIREKGMPILGKLNIIWMNLQWEHQQNIHISRKQKIHGT